jgi:methylenetetrahydrofolate--tRNA-(uracil-5-)-methyltransferase
MSSRAPVHVIGAGLAGSEAAWQMARRGLPVVLHEMRPVRLTPVHKTGDAAELVCSNSFRSDDALHNAVGLLHEEMRRLDSLIMRMGDAHKLPAGGALAVDRQGFATGVTQALESHELITIERGEVAGLPPAEWGTSIISTGPLTSQALAEAIREVTGSPSSMRSHRSCIATRSTWAWPGFNRAMTRLVQEGRAPIISIAR